MSIFIPRCFLMCWLITVCIKSVSAILFTPQIHFRLFLKLTQNVYWSFKENYASYIKILVTKATIIFINYYIIYIFEYFFFKSFSISRSFSICLRVYYANSLDPEHVKNFGLCMDLSYLVFLVYL